MYNLPAETYHRDPVIGGSLSSTGIKRLLSPSCPALYRYQLAHPPEPTDAMTFGSAVHKLALGAGAEIVVVEADSWRTKAARQAAMRAHSDGRIPLLRHDFDKAARMAAAVREVPLAFNLIQPGTGKPERTLVWQDPETGIWCRAMVDWLPFPLPGRRYFPVDLKTCPCAASEKVSKAIWDFGYHISGAHYLDGIRVLGIDARPVMHFIFLEKDEPHLVNVVELDPIALEAGRFYARQGRLEYAKCVAEGRWPSYSDEVEMVGLPPYAQNIYFQESGK